MYELEEMTGICRYCGQAMFVKAVDQENADDQATMKCECTEAKKDRRIREAYDQLHSITGDTSRAYGFIPMGFDVEELAENLLKSVIEHDTVGFTLELDDSILKCKEGSNGIKLSRTRKKTIEAKI